MQPNLDKIEIQEPPIQEIQKKRSCFLQTCSTGCGCLVFFIIGLILLLKFVATPRPRELAQVPPSLFATIEVYDEDSIDQVTYISGKRRGQTLELLTHVPKALLGPIVSFLNVELPEKDFEKQKIKETGDFWADALERVEDIEIDTRDVLTIRWSQLSAEPTFVEDFYKKELYSKDFTYREVKDSTKSKEYIFHRDSIDGTFFLEDNPKSPGTDIFVLTINIPTKK
ncbi:MAG: hypothetical protein ABII02_02950 [Candidatus Magasanikbacteria bacterium]